MPNEWATFSALAVKARDGSYVARVLEGPVPRWKPVFPWNKSGNSAGSGCIGKCFGLPRFQAAKFTARFPFAHVELADDQIPLEVSLAGWSPFVPGDADASSLPVAPIEYRFRNPSAEPVEFVYSFHSENFVAEGPAKHFLGQQVEGSGGTVTGMPGGFVLNQPPQAGVPSAETSLAAFLDEPGTQTDLAWFRGGWFDALTMLWKDISKAGPGVGARSPRASPAWAGVSICPCAWNRRRKNRAALARLVRAPVGSARRPARCAPRIRYSIPAATSISRDTPPISPISPRSPRIGRKTTPRSVSEPLPSPTPSTTAHSRRKSSRPSPRAGVHNLTLTTKKAARIPAAFPILPENYCVTGCISDCGPGGLEAGSGLGVGFVRGVLFSLFLLSVLSTVPGTGRESSEDAQPAKVTTAPITSKGT